MKELDIEKQYTEALTAKINEINALVEGEFAYIKMLKNDDELSFFVRDGKLYVEILHANGCTTIADVFCESGEFTIYLLKQYTDTVFNTVDTWVAHEVATLVELKQN